MSHTHNTVTTLLVKHLPEFITSSTELQQSYFKPYQPLDVRFMQGPAMLGFVFLDFPDRDTAQNAYQLLQKINFGLYYKPITVEYAKPNPTQTLLNQPELSTPISAEEYKTTAEPISRTHNLHYPPNPHLRYVYPDPTPDILANISYALGAVPRLYTQVLHLMNKLNMPPPFGACEASAKPLLAKRKRNDDNDGLLATDESELEDESEHEQDRTKAQEQQIKMARLSRIAAEKQKLAMATHHSTSSHTPAKPKIKINIRTPSDHSVPNEQQKAIQAQCLPLSELESLSAFKHYQPGSPTPKLYIKNLSKYTTEQDLKDLYIQFDPEAQVKLMTKGKLKGQAFVTFSGESIADLALKCTNGYVLHERPMAILFGRHTDKDEA
ncbi:hypothetical protein BD560DRAFT_382140 [Blakeslea trispora]|nr:hypothetical protein BD560DRAFT_382140 [Blakeslea trispora]